MNKDLFNGKIKKEFVSSIWASIIIFEIVTLGMGCFVLYDALSGSTGKVLLSDVALCIFYWLLGIIKLVGTVFVIRKYPKYKTLRHVFIKSSYFVGNAQKDSYEPWDDEEHFDTVPESEAYYDELNNQYYEKPKKIKRPKKYKIYIILTVICVLLMFINIGITYIIMDNIDLLPQTFQNEYLVFGVMMGLELLFIILSFAFAFRIWKMNMMTDEERREKMLTGNNPYI